MKRQTVRILKIFVILPIAATLLFLAGCATQAQYQRQNGFENDARVQNQKKARAARIARRDSARPVSAYNMAPEVRNLKVTQVGDQGIATYDLVGGDGVQEADILIAITVNGDRRTAEKLAVVGDYGNRIKVGPGKRIVWNAIEDLPPNFDGELSWDVKAFRVSASPQAGRTSARNALPAKVVYSGTTAEVKNLQVGQVGDNAVATYDLIGVGGVLEADVAVAIIIAGERRTSDRLSLTGDFGKAVKVGPGKKIIWNALADLPANFDGELSWDVKASVPTLRVNK